MMTLAWHRRFLQIPWPVVEIWHELPACEQRLYFGLCKLGDLHSATRLVLPAYFLRDHCGCDPKTVSRAAIGLARRGLVEISKDPRGSTYTLLDPQTHQPLPAAKGFSGEFVYEAPDGRNDRSVRQSRRKRTTAVSAPLAWHEIGTDRTEIRRTPSGDPPYGVRNSAVRPNSEVADKSLVNTQTKSSSEKSMKRESEKFGHAEEMEHRIRRRVVKKQPPSEPCENKTATANENITLWEKANEVAESPVVKRLAETFGAQIRALIDLRTGETVADPAPRGIPYEVWQRDRK